MQAPPGLPESCPFEVHLRPACAVVQVHPGIDEMGVKRQLVQHHEFKCLHFDYEAQAVEAAADNSSLKDELIKARAAAADADSYTVPSVLAKQLLDRRCAADDKTAWKVEWARRNEVLTKRKTDHEVCML